MVRSTVVSPTTRAKGFWSQTTGEQRVWGLAVAIAVVATIGGTVVWPYARLESAHSIPVWLLALLFYAGEIAVVHVKFKRNTQSFSMSEIPLVLGLFFISPALLVVAQLIGNAAALTINRRQPGLKLAFNLAQFSLVTITSVVLFRTFAAGADPFGPLGWVAAIGAVAAGNVVANGLVHFAIRATGGRLPSDQIAEVLLLSTLASAVNTSIALLAVALFETRPSAAWLALVPLVVLYGAYRAYIGQKQERARLEALYDITKVLHAAPQIDVAIEAAAVQAQRMFESIRVDVILLDQQRRGRVYQTTIEGGEAIRTMARADMADTHDLFGWLERLTEPMVLSETPPVPNASLNSDEIIAASLTAETGTIGAVIVTEPMSDVGGFGAADLKLLDAVADKISVTLRNGRLEDSLQELTQLKERLEDQVRSKDQFIATVSHELRTPLTTVMGLSHELGESRGQFSDAELDEIVNLIANESTELSHLIEDLLVGARADVSTLALHPMFASIREELTNVIQGHAHQTGQEPIRISCGSAREKLWADPLRLRQIVRNLLTNATRYGGDDIWIEVEDRADMIVIAVVDSGPGVPKHLAARIFEAYERGHDVGRAQPGSVGLGLAVSRRLASLMGGSLDYLRADDKTRFELVLPATPRLRS